MKEWNAKWCLKCKATGRENSKACWFCGNKELQNIFLHGKNIIDQKMTKHNLREKQS